MSIRYEFYQTPNCDGCEKKRYHARVVPAGRITTATLAKELERECTLTETDVKAVLLALGDKLAEHLSAGEKVHLDGIGFFQVNLKCLEEVSTLQDLPNEPVAFKSVSYRADADLKKHLQQQPLRRARTKPHSMPLTEQQLEEQLTAYFADQPTLTRRAFELYFNQTTSTAGRLLKRLVESGRLRNIATQYSPVYVPAPGYFGKKPMTE